MEYPADPSAPPPAAPAAHEMKPGAKTPDYVEFKIPEGFHVPDGVKPGEEFNAVGSFLLHEDGTMCLLEVEGSVVKPMAMEPDKDDKSKGGGQMSFVDSIESGMSSTAQ
ncbi:MAG: hypothetical protein ABI162_07025 [Luteolibacter sp.]